MLFDSINKDCHSYILLFVHMGVCFPQLYAVLGIIYIVSVMHRHLSQKTLQSMLNNCILYHTIPLQRAGHYLVLRTTVDGGIHCD
jgi:hypothetical protein